jgi:hypothetical protein
MRKRGPGIKINGTPGRDDVLRDEMKLRGEGREEMKLRVSRTRITDVIEDCMMDEGLKEVKAKNNYDDSQETG